MRILGIDPGLQVCGYAVVETGGAGEKLIEAGVFRTTKGLPIEEKLNQVSRDTETLLEKFRPEIVAVEELYSHYAHPKTAILMGHARGVILQKAAQTAIEVRSFSATRIKKSITGNGRASKGQVQRAIQAVLSLPALPEPSDVADAIAAALCCANSSRFVLQGRHRTKARNAVTWYAPA
ncbi:MAG TPA: crossover junction endodeoxyribonuclease RuvC [Sedimentisphaerales bacterium]|nr:crossover junction endodeoxyribonuclease RuvC [Sedimentisphaerales bacterium]